MATITICDKEIKVRASARIPYEYRYLFKDDLILGLGRPMTEGGSEVYARLAWLLARNAGEQVPENAEPERAVMEWLDSFDGVFSFAEAIPQINAIWLGNVETQSEPKKNSV